MSKKLICIMGKSGSGKTYIFEKMKVLFPELNALLMYTTRPKRPGETEDAYKFVKQDEMEKLKASHTLLAISSYETASGHWEYAYFDDLTKDSAGVFTPDQYRQVKNELERSGRLNKDIVMVPFLVKADGDARLLRLLKRDDSDDAKQEIIRRFLTDEADFSFENLKRCFRDDIRRMEVIKNDYLTSGEVLASMVWKAANESSEEIEKNQRNRAA